MTRPARKRRHHGAGPGPGPRASRGFTLIEVLVALVLMGLALITIAGLQGVTTNQTRQSYQNMQAAQMAQNMAERMRGNVFGVTRGYFTSAGGASVADPTVDCATSACTPQQEAAWELAGFDALLTYGHTHANVNAGGQAAFDANSTFSVACADTPCTGTSPWLITVFWDAERAGVTGYGCDPESATDLRCYRLSFVP